jgi:hypothetical protein
MLKIGELTSGLFAGDKLIAGKEFDIKQLVDNITFADDLVHEGINIQLILICNLSSIPVYLHRDSIRITENTDDARFIIVNIINSEITNPLTCLKGCVYNFCTHLIVICQLFLSLCLLSNKRTTVIPFCS